MRWLQKSRRRLQWLGPTSIFAVVGSKLLLVMWCALTMPITTTPDLISQLYYAIKWRTHQKKIEVSNQPGRPFSCFREKYDIRGRNLEEGKVWNYRCGNRNLFLNKHWRFSAVRSSSFWSRSTLVDSTGDESQSIFQSLSFRLISPKPNLITLPLADCYWKNHLQIKKG